MIELELSDVDMARIRFAHSPVWELATSVLALQEPAGRQVYGPWLKLTQQRLANHEFQLLRTLIAPGRYFPNFLTPPPSGIAGNLVEELTQVAGTEASVVRKELEVAYEQLKIPSLVRALYEEPERYLPRLVEEMQRYWEEIIAPVWSRIQALALADIAYRADQIAVGGIEFMFAHLHPAIALEERRVVVNKKYNERNRLGGRGLLLMPSAFVWPTIVTATCGDTQPSVCYPPRRIAELCEPEAPHSEALAAIIGQARTSLLISLELPLTTTELARRLDLTPAAVSQHLKLLKQARLVDSRRKGRYVYYQRTPAATALLQATNR